MVDSGGTKIKETRQLVVVVKDLVKNGERFLKRIVSFRAWVIEKNIEALLSFFPLLEIIANDAGKKMVEKRKRMEDNR